MSTMPLAMTDTDQCHDRSDAITWLGTVSLLLMLPGFFFYHSLVSSGLIPAFLGGYSSAVASLLMPALLIGYVQHLGKSAANRTLTDAAFIGFCGYYLGILLLQLATGARGGAVSDQIGVIPQFLSLFMATVLAPLHDRRMRFALLISFAVMSAIIFLNIDEGVFIMGLLTDDLADGSVATYQAYGFVYSVVLVLLIGQVEDTRLRILVYVVGLPALFLNGARTELVGVALMAPLLEFALTSAKLRAATWAVVTLALLAASLPILADMFPDSRTVLLFLDYGDDRSASERAEMLAHGLQSISDHPWFGDFANYPPGAHIHNWLSAWVDLGLVGFVIYAGLQVGPFLHIACARRWRLHEPVFRLPFLLLGLSLLFALTAKHFTHQLLPIALGAYTRLLMHDRPQRSAVKR